MEISSLRNKVVFNTHVKFLLQNKLGTRVLVLSQPLGPLLNMHKRIAAPQNAGMTIHNAPTALQLLVLTSNSSSCP